MIKTLTNLLKQDKEKFVVPKGVQDCIPITAIYDDGIFRVGKDKYSKSFKFTDINYAVASREDKEAMFLEYSELLNSLDSGATTKLTINNRRLNRLDFEKTILIPETGDELDVYREEYNKMLLDKATGANAIVQDKYVTISINKKSVEDARTYFARVGADLIAHFARLGSKCVELETDERLRIVHDFFRVGEETAYHFNIKETRKKGHDFKDYVCPDTMEFEKDYFKMGNRWYGFDSRVEWCACFVSWCANECGYIDAGIIPKYAGCVNGVQWFRDRGQWADGSYEPSPGTIIFFDWEGDGVTDHTGIVQKCENGTVYTVEGNSGDTCRTKTYTVGSSVIYGYGIPAY